jgi:hypothetical protein
LIVAAERADRAALDIDAANETASTVDGRFRTNVRTGKNCE